MRTLVYKRTHPHDPDERGCFGIEDCMGIVRAREFDAVIGVGGKGAEARSHEINDKVNWIGIGPHKVNTPRGYRGPLVTFDHFLLKPQVLTFAGWPLSLLIESIRREGSARSWRSTGVSKRRSVAS